MLGRSSSLLRCAVKVQSPPRPLLALQFAAFCTSDVIRLSKLMVERAMCSRREADRYIAAGKVEVDGVPVDQLGIKVPRSSHVALTAGGQHEQSLKRTIMLHKPAGVVSNLAEHGHPTAITLCTSTNFHDPAPLSRRQQPPGTYRESSVDCKKMAVCGRLDINSTGRPSI
jgi:23S rRNA pseudouridine2604 synthase